MKIKKELTWGAGGTAVQANHSTGKEQWGGSSLRSCQWGQRAERQARIRRGRLAGGGKGFIVREVGSHRQERLLKDPSSWSVESWSWSEEVSRASTGHRDCRGRAEGRGNGEKYMVDSWRATEGNTERNARAEIPARM